MGEEAFFIDQISTFIETSVLDETQRGFDQTTIYGKDTSIDAIVSSAKRFPMLAERQVIVVKEAQNLSRTIEDLLPYIKNPQHTTTLVICYKYKSIDKRKALYKALSKAHVVFESKNESAVLKALQNNHPYEEVAYELITTENIHQDIGMGMIGELSNEMDETAFLHYLKKTMKTDCVRHSPLLRKKIKKVAVLGGSGSFAISNAIQKKADVYIRQCKCRF